MGSVVSGLVRRGFATLVVDDASSDDTARRASEAGARVLRLAQRSGKGAAVRRGLAHARAAGYHHALILDADGQHLPADALRLLQSARRTGADLVVGDRMAASAAMPRLRWWVNGLMSFLVTLRTGQRVRDSQCGYRLLALDTLAAELRATGFDLETDMLLRARARGCRIAQTPITTIYRATRRSRIRPWRDALRFVRLLLTGQPSPKPAAPRHR